MEENVHLILEHVICVGVTGVLVVVEEYGVCMVVVSIKDVELEEKTVI
jgi:hypothetical protein